MRVPALELGDACSVPCVLLCRVRKMCPCMLVSRPSHLRWKGLVSHELEVAFVFKILDELAGS